MVDEINNPPPPVPPTTNSNVIFGKYEMGKKLGQGNFAKVYHCRNILTNDGVAIKVISKDHIMNSSCNIEQVQREISVMKLVRHPNIVEIKEVMATKSKIFVVMEYVKGGELFAKIVKGKVMEDQARKYFQQLISAVEFCHSRGVTHRDLKPENLLLDENGDLKVSDFGLSALPDQRRSDGLLYTQCGTPAYVAPEVLRKKGYAGHKADVWSCGVVLFVLLAGHLPFHDENVVRMYRKVFKGDYQFPPCFPDDARRLVSKLLVVDPEKRVSIDWIMMSDPWFLRGWIREWPVRTIAEEFDADPSSKPPQSTSPRFYNAFELISSLSSGFDLSSLFTEKRNKARSLFASKISASGVMSRLESAVKSLGFSVSCKENRVRMEGKNEGRKGRLKVVAEVFEVAPQLAVVEFSKCCGDTLEYARFCSEEVRPALKDIVWSWQGEE